MTKETYVHGKRDQQTPKYTPKETNITSYHITSHHVTCHDMTPAHASACGWSAGSRERVSRACAPGSRCAKAQASVHTARASQRLEFHAAAPPAPAPPRLHPRHACSPALPCHHRPPRHTAAYQHPSAPTAPTLAWGACNGDARATVEWPTTSNGRAERAKRARGPPHTPGCHRSGVDMRGAPVALLRPAQARMPGENSRMSASWLIHCGPSQDADF